MQPEHPARPSFAGKASPGPAHCGIGFFSALLLQTRPKAKNSFSVSTESPFIGDTVKALEVQRGGRARGWFRSRHRRDRDLGRLRLALGLGVTALGAEQGPDEAAEFTGDGDFGFVALEPASQEPGEPEVEAVLGFPAQGADLRGLALLAA